MNSPFTLITYGAWCVLGLVWLAGYAASARQPRTAHPRNLALQIPASALLLVCFALLFGVRFPVLRLLLTPPDALFGTIGVALDIAGVAFAIWARLALGRNWSGLVMSVREGHALVQTGPYAIVRHPIYAGLFAAIIGTALTIGTLAAWLGVAAGLGGFLICAEIEEKQMAAKFRVLHDAYRRRTKNLIPCVW
jgi:protein-S-isoprenylcysteine O-methyltransferase Ste14